MIRIDFETRSAAGYTWDPAAGLFVKPEGVSKSASAGLSVVGVAQYARHPSTEVLLLAYDDPEDPSTRKVWAPGAPVPLALVRHVAAGGLIGAFNSLFEFWIWNEILHKRHGWVRLPLEQLRDTMPRCRAWSIPGALGNAAKVLGVEQQKDAKGKDYIKFFSVPQKPTKKRPDLWNDMVDHPIDAGLFAGYCVQDVAAEAAVAEAMPELSDFELQVWLLDQRINVRGLPVDHETIHHAAELLRQAEVILHKELADITDGVVDSSGQTERMRKWIAPRGLELPDMRAETVRDALERDDLAPEVRRVLEIRAGLASTSTKKIWQFVHRCTDEHRIHGQFVYCGADRTGRWSGYGIQPHNFPRGDVRVVKCDACGFFHGPESTVVCCPDGHLSTRQLKPAKWCPEAMDQAIESFASRDFYAVQKRWGDPLKTIAGSLRGLIKAGPGKRLICSDFRAIEAVVLAVMAGEQWRIDVFNGHGKIYEMSASKITGTPLQDYLDYKKRTGDHHPDRQGIGKVAELASGYGGGVGAWKNFGADKLFTPEKLFKAKGPAGFAKLAADHARWLERRREWNAQLRSEGKSPAPEHNLQDWYIDERKKEWRAASPNIVAFWDGVESAAMKAIKDAGHRWHPYRGVAFRLDPDDGVLYCRLPSDRCLSYHQARIGRGRYGPAIFYKAWNTNAKMGPMGWIWLDTYGGKLTENIVQAVSRDILADRMLALDAAGYAIVGHIHDEVICEQEIGSWHSVEDMERVMSQMPLWAQGWPVIAAGGWEGERFRKD